jgi:hypothetical protein
LAAAAAAVSGEEGKKANTPTLAENISIIIPYLYCK